MDVRRMGRLAGDLDRFLRLFDDCFARSEGREHLRRYVRGQLSNVRRQCVGPMADALGISPRTLQDFLRNAKARRLHRRKSIRQLHALGIALKNGRRCIPPDP